MKPLVSIICISYNQEKYIKQAIEGFLLQNVNFDYEIIIHDDASTDGTQAIIQKYIKKQPRLFRPVLQTTNRYSKTGVLFLKGLYQMAKGKYVAVCEGDDFWIVSDKLQKQVDFLENNDDYAMVFHPVKVVYENKEESDSIFPEHFNKANSDLENLLKTNFIHTNSVLYRRQNYEDINPNVMPMDWYMHLYHARFGKIGFINKAMSVYRKHEEGIWWRATIEGNDEIWKKYGISHMVLYAELLKMYGDTEKYRLIIDKHIEGTIDILNRIDDTYGTNLIQNFTDRFSELDGILLRSLSRTTYANYRLIEELNGRLKVSDEKLQAESDKSAQLEREKTEIISSRSYKAARKMARVSHALRRNHEK